MEDRVMPEGIVSIHGKDYKTVAYRVNEFREQHPDFTIQTDLVEANDVLVIVKASIFNTESRLLATGYAEEVRAASKINRTSALENAETSAIGRALSALGLGGSQYASADELVNALQQQNDNVGPLMAHNEALQRNYASVYFIKEHLALRAWEAVAEAWGEITNDDKKALWLAPSKGGIFTTAERTDLRSNEFNEARKLILGDS
jgi:hypothetical protein